MKKIEIQVPALGESITEATVAKWFIKKGEHIKKDAVILELETDKVSQEIYASESGILENIFFQEGEDVNIGDTLGVIDPTSEEATDTDQEKEKIIENKNNNNKNSIKEVIVPSLGESITEAVIGKWIKSVGQEVAKGEPLVEIETDKVTQELYAEDNGVIKECLYQEQEEVKIGEIIARIELKSDLENLKKVASTESKEEKGASAIDQIAKEEKLKPEILNSDLDPTAVKRTGIGNKVTLLDLVEFSNDLSFSPSAKKTIREKSKNIHNTISLQNSNIITQSDALNNIQALGKS